MPRGKSVSVNLGSINYDIKRLADLLGSESPLLYRALWYAGEIIRDGCMGELKSVVYDTPESPGYKRTRFLYYSLYIATKKKNDNVDVRAHAKSLPEVQNAENKYNTATTYRFGNYERYSTPLGVRVTAGAIYALEVEMGNDVNPPRPFMRSGLDKSSREAQREVYNSVAQAINQMRKNNKIQLIIE